ncbi:MAG: type IV pilus assembly protein PilE [Polaromonas sp.]
MAAHPQSTYSLTGPTLMFDLFAFAFTVRNAPYRLRAQAAGAGFSLIELLVVLVIVGIVSAIALPNYRQHIQRGHRAEAAGALLEAQHFMERYYSAHGRYDGTAQEPGQPPKLPLRLQGIPAGADLRYQLKLDTVTVNAYELRAEPVGSMAGDKCGTLTLNQTGLKGLADSEISVADCWR